MARRGLRLCGCLVFLWYGDDGGIRSGSDGSPETFVFSGKKRWTPDLLRSSSISDGGSRKQSSGCWVQLTREPRRPISVRENHATRAVAETSRIASQKIEEPLIPYHRLSGEQGAAIATTLLIDCFAADLSWCLSISLSFSDLTRLIRRWRRFQCRRSWYLMAGRRVLSRDPIHFGVLVDDFFRSMAGRDSRYGYSDKEACGNGSMSSSDLCHVGCARMAAISATRRHVCETEQKKATMWKSLVISWQHHYKGRPFDRMVVVEFVRYLFKFTKPVGNGGGRWRLPVGVREQIPDQFGKGAICEDVVHRFIRSSADRAGRIDTSTPFGETSSGGQSIQEEMPAEELKFFR
ncbi:hypothetical protein MRB53_004820 [Persea americana]|uniref:Uncharacterized protein n=1 Tax=Persea americana TaxID=3435 RepID=A0ACC2MBK8_PERAE|nr:hypothetical protein MRB53_004820 [Persea americana]